MSALAMKADICAAKPHVRFGPKADMILKKMELGKSAFL